MIRIIQIAIVLGSVCLVGCSTALTTFPAVLVGAYEMSNKRRVWREYALDGDVYAQYELAESYCCRASEGELNQHLSFQWYCTAAKHGFAKAQLQVGKIYENAVKMEDLMVPKNNVKAYVWYTQAAKRQNLEAIDRIEALDAVLTEHDRGVLEFILADTDNLPCGV